MGVLGLVDNGRGHGRRRKVEFGSVSIPKPVLKKVDELIKKLGFWPSRSAFVREATIKMIREEWPRLGTGEEPPVEDPMKGQRRRK